MPVKIIRVPYDGDFKGDVRCYQDPKSKHAGATVKLTKAFVSGHFRDRIPSEIVVVAWIADAVKGGRQQ